MRAYWFEPADGKLGYGDGRKPVKGETHKIKGVHSLHASIRAIDALKYAQSNIIWEVELSGNIMQGKDRCAASKRTYLRRIDGTDILFQCSCRFALSVAHLWDMPSVVRAFLETGNKDLRVAAFHAASAASGGAANAAAWAAASGAAWVAAREAALDAARDTARAAARKRLRSRSARAAAARSAAAQDAARAAQNVLLESLLSQAEEMK
jgi:hypothetical protein